ncbi:hypothetical protein [Bradyrhizobium sp. LA2.1]|uniref:hypothetical protein n=1 Tax=Bradyrhizobium sp. LA2.1 TaxID=3156376 RepID=UPI003391E944
MRAPLDDRHVESGLHDLPEVLAAVAGRPAVERAFYDVALVEQQVGKPGKARGRLDVSDDRPDLFRLEPIDVIDHHQDLLRQRPSAAALSRTVREMTC